MMFFGSILSTTETYFLVKLSAGQRPAIPVMVIDSLTFVKRPTAIKYHHFARPGR
jgi:hypothetical protein